MFASSEAANPHVSVPKFRVNSLSPTFASRFDVLKAVVAHFGTPNHSPHRTESSRIPRSENDLDQDRTRGSIGCCSESTASTDRLARVPRQGVGSQRGGAPKLSLFEGDDCERRKCLEQLAGPKQEVGIVWLPEAFVAVRESLVNQQAAGCSWSSFSRSIRRTSQRGPTKADSAVVSRSIAHTANP